MNTAQLIERLKSYVRAAQTILIGESYGEGECFTGEDLQGLSSGGAQAVAGALIAMRPLRQLRAEFSKLDAGAKEDVLRAARECFRPTWETLGRVSGEGQTQAGQDAEKFLAAAVAEYLDKGIDLPTAPASPQPAMPQASPPAAPQPQGIPAPARTAIPKEPTTPDGKWDLVWQDDFDGPTLDYTKWECEVNAFGGGNNELQLYTDYPKNIRVEDRLGAGL